MAGKIDPEEYQKRLSILTDIFSEIVQHADEQSQTRCPYKSAEGRCTAKFGCRNQQRLSRTSEAKICGGDDKIDYRTAWETDGMAETEVRTKILTQRENAERRRRGEEVVARGDNLFDRADEHEMRVPSSCGRMGVCHECVVEVTEGMDALAPRTDKEAFLQGNYRLACQANILDPHAPIQFKLLRRTPQILTTTADKAVALDPVVRRQGDKVMYGDAVMDTYRGRILGLAVDLGTTTVAIALVDLETGETIRTVSMENPQRFGGSDVMSRISYDGKHPRELWQSLVKAINQEIYDLGEELGFTRHVIYEAVIAGNATMRDLLFKLDVQGIGQKPYKSSVELEWRDGQRETTSLMFGARQTGLAISAKGTVYSLPLIASHVGADTAAVLLAIDMAEAEGTVMMVDVGTNTEVVIKTNGKYLAASCPAGPAFEGGLVKYGMPGQNGAIDHVRWVGDHFDYSVIGGVPAEGICGSGLFDLIAELRRHELITPKGVFGDRKQREMMVAPDTGVTIGREDLSNLAQAKAANYCGQLILLRHLGLMPDQVDKLYLAGGFANYIDTQAAIDIGFLPPVPIERIVKVGNASLQGAREALINRHRRAAIEALAPTIDHIELETTKDFFELFVEGCQFKPMPADLGAGR
jgi:uncharacterized 2Fe-2S/4Fe-4S cluster protein (DUF4445 family)